MRIAYWLNGLGLGGTEKAAQLFAKYLPEFDIEFFTYHDAEHDRVNLINRKVNFIWRKNGDFRFLKDFDIVHAFRSGHAEKPEPQVDYYSKIFIETNAFGLLSNNPAITRTLFMSKWLMQSSLNYYGLRPTNRFDYINNPTEKPSTQDRYIDLPSDHIILGRAGRPTDGVYDPISILAVKHLIDAGHKIFVLCLSAPPSMTEFMLKQNIPHKVLDATIDPYLISKFYNSIDVYIEGRPDGHTFGNVLAEAQMHGKPCVGHKAVRQYPEQSVYQAQTETICLNAGFCVNYDVSEFAAAILAAYNNRAAFDPILRNFAIENFEASVSAAKLKLHYENTLKGL